MLKCAVYLKLCNKRKISNITRNPQIKEIFLPSPETLKFRQLSFSMYMYYHCNYFEFIELKFICWARSFCLYKPKLCVNQKCTTENDCARQPSIARDVLNVLMFSFRNQCKSSSKARNPCTRLHIKFDCTGFLIRKNDFPLIQTVRITKTLHSWWNTRFDRHNGTLVYYR